MMAGDEFQSMSKGVFVIPFQPSDGLERQTEAGPSTPRSVSHGQPLKELYTASLDTYGQALERYNAAITAEQLDDIADWLERSSAPPILKLEIPVHRLPIAIIQNSSSSLPSLLSSLGTATQAFTLHGRDAPDIAVAMRAIAIGFTGETSVSGKKSGQAGLDEVETWWKSKKNKPELLLHIQDAQTIPASVLGEIIYILTLHPHLPIRLLLSVPSTAHFLSSWTLLEPSSIALSILSSGNKRRRGGVDAILDASKEAPIKISDYLAEEILEEENRTGGGTSLVLKAIKWLLLHHSMNSPLASLSSSGNSEQLQKLQALADALANHPDDPSLPGRELFQLDPHPDLSSVLNPAPRISILHALSNSGDFVSASATDKEIEELDRSRSPSPSPTKPARSKRQLQNGDEPEASNAKRRRTAAHVHVEPESESNGEPLQTADGHGRGEELKELQTLFELWRSAGRSVSLWDWLEGFSGIMSESKSAEGESGNGDSAQKEGAEHSVEDVSLAEHDNAETRIEGGQVVEAEKSNGGTDERRADQADTEDAENEARLHAVFIRFVEEARMIGLIRARGKGRRADEVVKGVGLV